MSAAREGLDTQIDLLMLHTDVHILCKASFRKVWRGGGGGGGGEGMDAYRNYSNTMVDPI